MKKWFCSNLGDDMAADEILGSLTERSTNAFNSTGNPRDMAAFIRHESEGRLHCQVKIYLSPGSVAVAKMIDAKPCSKPSVNGLSLLAGRLDSWQTFFPDHKPGY